MGKIRTWLGWKRYNDTHFMNDTAHLFSVSGKELLLDQKIFRFPSVAVTNFKGQLRNKRSHSSLACFCLQYNLKKEIRLRIYVGICSLGFVIFIIPFISVVPWQSIRRTIACPLRGL